MSPDSALFAVKIAFSLVALVAIGIVVIRPMLRMIKEKPDIDLVTPDYTSLLDEEESELQIPEGMEGSVPQRTEIIQQAKSDPRITATMVQQWLKEKK